MLLLDASIWVAAGMPANPNHEAAAALVRGERPVAVLDLTLYEVANAIGLKYRQPEEARKLCRVIMRRCGDRPVRVDSELLATALEDMVKHGITAYDAAYVAAARRHGWQLVSVDIRDLVSKGLAVTPDAADYP